MLFDGAVRRKQARLEPVLSALRTVNDGALLLLERVCGAVTGTLRADNRLLAVMNPAAWVSNRNAISDNRSQRN